MRFLSHIKIIILACLVFLASDAHAALISTLRIPSPITVEETRAELGNKGCTVAIVQGALRQVNIPDGYISVLPRDSDRTKPTAIGEEHPFMFCPPDVVESKLSIREQEVDSVQQTIIWMINGVLTLLANVGIWILNLSSKILGELMAVGKFVTNDFVKNGWPFVQGFANLGFIIALLMIAVATTLRLDIGAGGVRRLLPRLLIAALLINFSLVIAGVIIDASRLLMAVIVRPFINDELSNIGIGILKNSGILDETFRHTTFLGTDVLLTPAENNKWSIPLRTIQGTVVIWGLAVGMVFVSVGLLVRYIALILLLIASPLAFLALALPWTYNLAIRWWNEFLKWVLYGPIALFFLVLIAAITSGGIIDPNDNNAGIASLLSVGITTALLIASVMAAKSLGGFGAGAAMGFAAAKLNQARRGATRAATTGLYVGTGTRAVVRQARDFGGEVKSELTKKARSGDFGGMAKLFVGPRRKQDGSLADGETSFGLRRAKALTRSSGDTTRIAQAKSIKSNDYYRGLALADKETDTTKKATYGRSTLDRVLENLGVDTSDKSAANKEKIMSMLSDGNFTLNLPPDLFRAFMQYGNEEEKKAVGAAIAGADMGAMTTGQRKNVIRAIIEGGDKQIISNAVNNIDLVENMSGGDKTKVHRLGDDKISNRLTRTIRAAKARK